MRNDARPIGHDADPSPIGGPQADVDRPEPAPRGREPRGRDREADADRDANRDPVMPADDSSLTTTI
jgi:hypothetical protein